MVLDHSISKDWSVFTVRFRPLSSCTCGGGKYYHARGGSITNITRFFWREFVCSKRKGWRRAAYCGCKHPATACRANNFAPINAPGWFTATSTVRFGGWSSSAVPNGASNILEKVQSCAPFSNWMFEMPSIHATETTFWKLRWSICPRVLGVFMAELRFILVSFLWRKRSAIKVRGSARGPHGPTIILFIHYGSVPWLEVWHGCLFSRWRCAGRRS